MSSQAKKILFIVAHPNLSKSRANRAVVEAVRHFPNVSVHSLYDRFPDFHIRVEREQELLLRHDVIVVQHPFYWYSMPALMKLWLDEVLESGWAYGQDGDKLKGKDFLLSLTIGGGTEAYHENGRNRFSIETLISPWNQTVHLCQMRWHKPLLLHGAIKASSEQLTAHAQAVVKSLEHWL